MIQKTKEILYIKQNSITDELINKNSLFFDIETTGFSPAHSNLYMIGYAYKSHDNITINQLFAQNTSEEKEILEIFISQIKSFSTILSFNGIGFDIPYLKGKCKQYNIDDIFSSFSYIDIFKEVSCIKGILNLENYKQKSIEKFLGIVRDDIYSGGQLIDIYKEYIQTQDQRHLETLLLHNYEDVLGMIDLLPVLSYNRIFQGSVRFESCSINTYIDINGYEKRELFIKTNNLYDIPQKLSCKKECFHIFLEQNHTTIRIPLIDDELLFFYPNYKDYYYLPLEDRAIHKSVSAYVDKEFRKPCKASNCYIKKKASFIPQLYTIFKPEFKKDYKDKLSYFELTNDFLQNPDMINKYIEHILNSNIKMPV